MRVATLKKKKGQRGSGKRKNETYIWCPGTLFIFVTIFSHLFTLAERDNFRAWDCCCFFSRIGKDRRFFVRTLKGSSFQSLQTFSSTYKKTSCVFWRKKSDVSVRKTLELCFLPSSIPTFQRSSCTRRGRASWYLLRHACNSRDVSKTDTNAFVKNK